MQLKKAETEIKGGDCMHSECNDDNGRSCTVPEIFQAEVEGPVSTAS